MLIFSKNRPKNLKILYAAGPGNVIGTYQYWIKNEDDPGQTSITYSGQFYTVCRDLNAQAYVIAYNLERRLITDDLFTIEHRPIPLRNSSGILYYLGMFWYGLGLLVTAIRFQANVAIISEGTVQWFMLHLFTLLGIKVIPSLHCVLFLKYIPINQKQQLLLNLSRRLFTKDCTAILVVSDEIGEQVKKITNCQNRPIIRSLSVYRREQFANIIKPDLAGSPFHVLFVGRIEINKGVFTLLEVAKYFVDRQTNLNIRFDLCGDGSALADLKKASEQAGINSFFVCHGHCNKTQIRQMFSQSHVVIVPTKTDFNEGFNKVVVEGILANRPVVASKVCTDLELLQDAVIAVEPDEPQGYTQAILQLMSDRLLYQKKQEATYDLQEQFYDLSKGWGAQLQTILVAIQEGLESETALDLAARKNR